MPIEALTVPIETVTDLGMKLGECPVWSIAEQVLYWIDIPGHALYRFDPATGAHRSWPMPATPGSIGLFEGGDLLLALRTGLFRFSPDSAAMSLLHPADYDQSTTRFNDGRADSRGRFWVGTMFEPLSEPLGRLYSFGPEQQAALHDVGPVTISNGLAFSPDGKVLYFADTPAKSVWRFDLDPDSGTIRNQRPFLELGPALGRPDGAAVDASGCYWSALFGCVARFTPDGKFDRAIRIPAGRITMCAFGGSRLDTLFVTTTGLEHKPKDVPAEPLAGRVLALNPGVSGLPEPTLPRAFLSAS